MHGPAKIAAIMLTLVVAAVAQTAPAIPIVAPPPPPPMFPAGLRALLEGTSAQRRSHLPAFA